MVKKQLESTQSLSGYRNDDFEKTVMVTTAVINSTIPKSSLIFLSLLDSVIFPSFLQTSQIISKTPRSITLPGVKSFIWIIYAKLLNCSLSSGFLKFLLDVLSLFLANALFNNLGSSCNKILSFLKSETCDLTNNLDYRNA